MLMLGCHSTIDLELNSGLASECGLIYPEVYLLQDGYKGFYTRFPELCQPNAYIVRR